ncbi:HigA family addiction module antitoxin [Pedobacter metabolipauper]|uniref:HTH-type transcriptional regulator/antitoxin HigA n=1 Tax=Pedobacter metabolipauper TaxID=425513 RepID=A0A4R6SVQ5_9SPHI|nr:HigA family addiction module antitoxin [Pedobacter metabolipauper]TDQ08539.1 HTH-type transcriptional regulator/antitoxin HigA [Pedobacter metabolipauper]
MKNQITTGNGIVLTPTAYHPGEFLQEEIEERALLKKEVAKALDILPNHLSEIFVGKRHISAALAVKLENLLGISAEYWYGLQTAYDLQKAREPELLRG